MPERFLILGSRSFYGNAFAGCVQDHGDEINLYSKPHFNIDDGLSRDPHEVRKSWRWVLDSVKEADYIVNFISKSLVAESWVTPGDWCKTNVEGTTRFLEAIKGFKGKYIHVSTPEVYGSTPHWVNEDYTDWQPSTPYAVSRAAGDMMLKAYHKAYGFPMIITRTANIYGPGQQDYRIIPKALSFKREGKVLPLHGGGWSKRSFIHIKDACEATYLLCKDGKVGETYHISTNEDHWIRDVVHMVGCEYEDCEDRLGKDEAYLLDSKKLRSLGWSDTIKLEEGIRQLG